MKFDQDLGELFDVRIGFFGIGAFFGARPFRVGYSRSSDFHIFRLLVDKEVKKEDIKVRFVKPGIIEKWNGHGKKKVRRSP